MIRFLKAQASSLIGTAADFLTAIFLVEALGCWYVSASGLGNLVGGVVQFSLARRFVFEGRRETVFFQIIRYGIVWAGNILLSALLVYLLTHGVALHYIVSKVIVSIVMGTSYNYILQKNYVFK